MATHLVNLDALIPRISFDAAASKETKTQRPDDRIKLPDLDSFYSKLLYKPDFQRETSSWKAETIAEFIQTFVEGEVIPAVIAWYAPNGTIIVIDGAHRLSALLAWIRDDYGAGPLSQSFWGYNIPAGQKRLADRTRELVEKEIGTYQHLKRALEDAELSTDDPLLVRARKALSFRINIQWIEGTADKAESSFFKINRSASPIDPVELAIIKARAKPNAIATRALMNVGRGYEYWKHFTDTNKKAIAKHAESINELLFKPLYESPVKTPDLPIAGAAYSSVAFRLILNLVNLVNEVSDSMWTEQRTNRAANREIVTLPDDNDGTQTVQFLSRVEKAATLISGDSNQGSLGLHPLVYFYGPTGRFQPSAFLATIAFFLDLKKRKQLQNFTAFRKDFEEFLIQHRHFVMALSHSKGSGTRALNSLVTMYELVLKSVQSGATNHDQIVAALQAEPSLYALKQAKKRVYTSKKGSGFVSDAKSFAFIQSALNSPVRCAGCGARMHMNAITTDHRTRLQDGGTNDPYNAQPMHPFCNSGVKEARRVAGGVSS